MNAYNGLAVIISEDDTEVPVTATLRRYRAGLRTDWRGTLTPSADGLRQLLNLTKGRLRFPDGKEADFLRPDTSDWITTKQLTILGQNEPPF